MNSPSELYTRARRWLEPDIRRIEESLQTAAERFRGKRVLVTGAAGFLGFNFLHFFSYLNRTGIPVSVVAVDNFLRGRPRWLDELLAADPNVVLKRADIKGAALA